MEPVLRNGDISGKLVCPNEKCGAKIGNFDWAGVQCGCKEWVTPVRLFLPSDNRRALIGIGLLYQPKQGGRGLVMM